MGIIHRLGIDVDTKDAAKLAEKLSHLKATQSAMVAGAYEVLPDISQVHVHTQMDEKSMDEWLYTNAGKCEWHGVFTLPDRAKPALIAPEKA